MAWVDHLDAYALTPAPQLHPHRPIGSELGMGYRVRYQLCQQEENVVTNGSGQIVVVCNLRAPGRRIGFRSTAQPEDQPV